MSEEIAIFIGGAVTGILTIMTIFLFKYLMKMGRQIRRSVFVTTVTMLMAVCGLAIELAVNDRFLLVVILTLSKGAIGVVISLIVSLVLYNQKELRK